MGQTMDQFDLESVFVAGVLDSVDNMLVVMSKSRVSFSVYITNKELRFVFSAASRAYNTYSSALTEQLLISLLMERGAPEEDLLKYRSLFKTLKRRKTNDADFRYSIDRMIDNYVSRGLIDSMLQTQEVLQRENSGKTAFELLEKNMMVLKDQMISKDIRETSTERITEEVALYNDMRLHPEKYRGIKIGVTKLDDITGGFRKGELVVALGATKVGKSIFLLNCQYNTMKNGYTSLFVSIEMSLEQCRRRLVSRITELPYLKIKNVALSPAELAHMQESLTAFEQRHDGHSIMIDVPENCTPKMVEARVRSLLRTRNVDVIILDYLLLMSPSVASQKMSREERVTQVALELKQLARSLNIPIITATQVTAKAAERVGKKDESYDWTELSQAKSVATHADWVLSLKREPDLNILNLGITAGRDGALDEVIPLVIDYSRMLIGNYVESSTDTQSSTPIAPEAQVKTGDSF